MLASNEIEDMKKVIAFARIFLPEKLLGNEFLNQTKEKWDNKKKKTAVLKKAGWLTIKKSFIPP